MKGCAIHAGVLMNILFLIAFYSICGDGSHLFHGGFVGSWSGTWHVDSNDRDQNDGGDDEGDGCDDEGDGCADEGDGCDGEGDGCDDRSCSDHDMILLAIISPQYQREEQ
jgi:hypothetical protein